jgi:uncharacterized protein
VVLDVVMGAAQLATCGLSPAGSSPFPIALRTTGRYGLRLGVERDPSGTEVTVADDQVDVVGVPCWADLTSPDLVASARFYGELLGWDTASGGGAGLTGGHLSFRIGGHDVAGLGPLPDDEPPAWTTYVAVASADATEAVVQANGGTTLLAPEDVDDLGRVALFADPTGAVIGVWEAREHPGAALVDAPGAMCWQQLACREIEVAKEFYGAAFGWVGITSPYETSTYTTWNLNGREPGRHGWGIGGLGRAVAGMVEMDRSWPRDLPPHWLVCFAVEDCDQAAEQAGDLGGEVSVEPLDVAEVGRLAVLGDPHGAVFAVVTWAETETYAQRARGSTRGQRSAVPSERRT